MLLFAAPASPLAQPWSIVGGNTVAALTGVARAIADPLLAAPAAAALAIVAMFTLRCLHPPGGAIALAAVLGGPAVRAAGFHFALVPVALNSAVLMLAAIAFNNATGRLYPHPQAAPKRGLHQTTDGPPTLRSVLGNSDLDAILARYDQVLDISRDELERLFQAAELRAFDRVLGDITCADIMSRDVVAAQFGTPISNAWALLLKHDMVPWHGDVLFLTGTTSHSFWSLPDRAVLLLRPAGCALTTPPSAVAWPNWSAHWTKNCSTARRTVLP